MVHFNAITKKKEHNTDTKAQSGSWTSRAVLVEPLLPGKWPPLLHTTLQSL